METSKRNPTIRSTQANAHAQHSDENTALLNTSAAAPDTTTTKDGYRSSLALRISAAMYSFFVLGLFTSSIGVILTPVARYYTLSDIKVSILFLVGPAAYICAAQANSYIHARYGQRGIAFLAPLLHFVAALAIASHPRFALLLPAIGIAFVGHGLLDGSWCAWAAAMPNANRISGLLHGSFSVGAAVGPAVASAIMDGGRRPWWLWYWILVIMSALEWLILLVAFRDQTGAQDHDTDYANSGDNMSKFQRTLRHPALWISAVYFLAYVGTETAISGWIVSFMIRSRQASQRLSSFSASGFWLGMAAGRLGLGALTDGIGVRRAMIGYLVVAIALQGLFAQIRNVKLSIGIATMLGFVMGPMFPSGVVLLTGLLPGELHVSAVSTTASIGQVGAALLPFGIGAVIHALNISVFKYAIVISTTITLVLWIAFTSLKPKFTLQATVNSVTRQPR